MWEICYNNLTDIASAIAIVLSIGGTIFWSHRLLHGDMMRLQSKIDAAHDRIDQANNRIDQSIQAFNARMDDMYKVIMTHLLK
jgi:hypothetical protein